MQYLLTFLIASMGISSTVIGLFRLQASSKKEMTAQEKLTFNWWMPSVYDKELAMKSIPKRQFNKYWFFVQVQNFSLLGILAYLLIILFFGAHEST